MLKSQPSLIQYIKHLLLICQETPDSTADPETVRHPFSQMRLEASSPENTLLEIEKTLGEDVGNAKRCMDLIPAASGC